MCNFRFSQDGDAKGRESNAKKAGELLERMRQGGVALCGAGRSNFALLSWLLAHGVENISVRDRRPRAELHIPASADLCGVRFLTGSGYLEAIGEAVVFRTPSLRPDVPELLRAAEAGALLLSEAALFTLLCPAPLYAVTGSDGKTTTAMLTGAMLRAAGRRCFVGENIGMPLLPYADIMKPDDAVVCEFSSFQLMDFFPHPYRAAITNISENHLDWHTDMREYAEAKSHIFGALTVLNADCTPTKEMAGTTDSLLFSSTKKPAGDAPCVFVEDGWVTADTGRAVRLFPVKALPLPGRYNLENALCAAGLCLSEVPPGAMEEAVRRFRGAPHRMEYVGTFDGIRCYDSSIDTTPARTAAALSSFPGKPVVIVGGRGKNLSFAPLADALIEYAGAVVVTGECAGQIHEALLRRKEETHSGLTVVRAPLLADAVGSAFRLAPPGGAILLSPAATSFDEFSDYAERGRAFAALCRLH